jgi:hypothetical protein
METKDINKELKDYKCYIGTFARDLLPKKSIIERPIALIINTDKSNKPGQHWMALFIDKNNNAEYLDSYGFSPIHNEIINFLAISKVKTIQYNSQQLQSVITSTCGAYCVLFIKMRCNDLNYCKFLKLFTKNKLFNDLIVTKLI